MNKLRLQFNSRLTSLNQRSFMENFKKSTFIFSTTLLIGGVYFIIAYSMFHKLWYHKIFAALSASLFAYCFQDLYYEHVEKKVKLALPKTTKKLAHYYIHFRGSIIPALKETEERCPEDARYYLIKIRKAVLSGDPNAETEKLKESFPFAWYRMLASLVSIAKEKGMGGDERGEENVIGSNLMKITNILSFINVQQGYNDAELRFIQLFLYFAPFIFIIASDWINGKILIEMNLQDVYQGVKAQNMKSYIFLASNLSALFIHWMRKQQI